MMVCMWAVEMDAMSAGDWALLKVVMMVCMWAGEMDAMLAGDWALLKVVTMVGLMDALTVSMSVEN
jgi:hypothetical protein